MKRILILIPMALLMLAPGIHADALFEDMPLSSLSVMDTSEADGKALVQNREGRLIEVWIGDTIGWERAEVIDVDDYTITVELDELRTLIPIIDPVVKD